MSKKYFQQLGNNQKVISDQVHQVSNEVFDNHQRTIARFTELELKVDYLTKLISDHLLSSFKQPENLDIKGCKVTISQLAELSGVSPSAIYSWIRREILPKPTKSKKDPLYYKGEEIAEILFKIWEVTRPKQNSRRKLWKPRT